MKKKDEWHVGACKKEERTFLQLMFGGVVVKELPFLTDSDLEGVSAIFEKTAKGLNLLGIKPSTIQEYEERKAEKFPLMVVEQQELELVS